jgi:DNA-binding FadR family transcriptional regulator
LFVNLNALRKTDVRSQVFDVLLERISGGYWKPGDKLPSENELTKTLGIIGLAVDRMDRNDVDILIEYTRQMALNIHDLSSYARF